METRQVSVVAPCFNEESNVEVLVERLASVFKDNNLNGEVVLVDDASTDNTRSMIQGLQSKYHNVRLVAHDENKGIAGAWQSGIDAAKGEYVCFIDADLQNLPEDVARLYQEIVTKKVGLVQGWRKPVLADGNSVMRGVVSRGLNFFLNTLFGMHLTDNKSGFVMAKKDVLAHVIQHRGRYTYFQTFIAVSAKKKGYSISEVETVFAKRNAGQSYIQGKILKAMFLTVIDLVKGIWEFGLFARPRKS